MEILVYNHKCNCGESMETYVYEDIVDFQDLCETCHEKLPFLERIKVINSALEKYENYLFYNKS